MGMLAHNSSENRILLARLCLKMTMTYNDKGSALKHCSNAHPTFHTMLVTSKVCDTDNCIGYSYAPCERICTLHGEPELFRGLPLPERWSTLNGRVAEQVGISWLERGVPDGMIP